MGIMGLVKNDRSCKRVLYVDAAMWVSPEEK